MKRTHKSSVLIAMCAACLSATPLLAQLPKGQWDFNSSNLTATVGAPMEYVDGPGGATAQNTRFGTTTSFGIPDIGGTPAQVMKFPANTNATLGFKMPTPPANGGGQFVNEWTLTMDILFPAESDRKWRALIETDGRTLTPDSDWFVNTGNQLGIGSYFGSIASNTWYRIGMVVQTPLNRITFYINGTQVGFRDGINSGVAALDGRWALADGSAGAGFAELFNDDDGEAASGYVNSIQIRDVASTSAQMAALGGPSASGIPQTIPAIPTFLERAYPVGFARPTDKIGFVLNRGDATISNVVFRIGGQTVTPTTTTSGATNTYEVPSQNFARQSDHTAVLSYSDSVAGARNFTNQFRVPIFYEDFDLLALGPSVDPALGGEPNSGTNVWTMTPPAGWSVDNSKMPPQSDPPSGRPEWEGWSFADREWWSTKVDRQLRETFIKGRGAVAIADPDEWDDFGNPDALRGYFTSFLLTAPISLQGAGANTAFARFDSSWLPEGMDDPGPDGLRSNNQTAIVLASFNGGTPIQLLKWDSDSGSPTFHPNSPNETVNLPLNNPVGATNLVLTFVMTNAANDWWWAFDNLVIDAGAVPPAISQQPADLRVTEDGPATFTVAATGTGPLAYQWYRVVGTNKTAIAGATAATYTIAQTVPGHAGLYRSEVRNAGGTVSSSTVRLVVLYRNGTLFTEDFNGLTLGPNIDEGINTGTGGPTNNVWTKTPPAGWSIDDSGVPGVGDPAQDGVTEWAGWSFANKDWWAAAGGQGRSTFTKATGAAAIADSDEWDDITHAGGNMATYLKTRNISLQGVRAGSVILVYDSSWNDESPQKANVTVAFDGGAPVEIYRYESEPASPNYKPAALNETLVIPVNNPAGATNMVITFGYFDTRNNWWWAIDNILVTGARTPLFFEDFESLALGPNVDEGIITGSGGPQTNVWTKTPPAGWSIDDTGVPGAGDPAQDGVTEWAGWSFAKLSFWSAAGGQNRSDFTRAFGTVAIADSDEWDDVTHAAGNMATYLKTSDINIAGQAPGTLVLRFYSSWRAEEPQKANVTVSYNGGVAVEVLRWESATASPNFHDNRDETVIVPLNNPAGATSMRITFGYFDTRNNWWWAVDNIEVSATAAATNLGKVNAALQGSNVSLSWTGGAGIRLQRSSSLNPAAWQDVAGTDGQSSATVAISGNAGHFRLFKP